jgi:hypothetical protein
MIVNRVVRSIFIFVFLGLASCAATGIPAPGKPTDTLMVCPRLFIDAALVSSLYIFDMSLMMDVESVTTGKEDQIVFSPMTADYVFFRNFKPGRYIIKDMKLRMKTGTSFRDLKYSKSIMQYIEIAPGRMTIFPFKVVISINDNSGYFYYDFYELKKEDYLKITAFLRRDPNFKLWQVTE